MSEFVGAQRAAPNAKPRTWAQHAAPLQFGAVAVFVVLLDQISKIWLRNTLPLGSRIEVLPGWVHLSHSLNNGAAWGMMSGQRWLLILVSVGVSIFIFKMAREYASRGVLPMLALAFILGGAIGNLIDRVLFGVVTDMIDLDTPLEALRAFPVFNVADSALTVGVILLMLHFLLNRETESQPLTTDTRHASDSL